MNKDERQMRGVMPTQDNEDDGDDWTQRKAGVPDAQCLSGNGDYRVLDFCVIRVRDDFVSK